MHHIARLANNTAVRNRARRRRKAPLEVGESTLPGQSGCSLVRRVPWHAAWARYVHAGIASEPAAELINTFLLQAMATSGVAHDEHGGAPTVSGQRGGGALTAQRCARTSSRFDL